MTGDTTPVLECRDLSISFRTRSGLVPAVVNFNLTVGQGEAVGLVGESGCGKSTVALAIMRHLGRNGHISGGSIHFMGRDITTLSPDELRAIRGSAMAMVYQEPMASLNPSMRIKNQLVEVLQAHQKLSGAQMHDKILRLLLRVDLADPHRILGAYPHQLSGGQQQRVLIVMALLADPKLLILDEPTTALDVTVEAGLVQLIGEIAAEFGTAIVYISHNLGLIRDTCDAVTIMYSGRAVEHGSIGEVFGDSRHPYTKGLLHAIPLPWASRTERPLQPIRGNLPLPSARPPGCFFGPRCDHFVAGQCDTEFATQLVDATGDHRVHCIRQAEIGKLLATSTMAPEQRSEPGPEILAVEHLQKHYVIGRSGLTGKSSHPTVIKANEDLDFTVREGETVAIVGESGCGKSTFAKMVIGLETATGGQLMLRGRDISRIPVQRRDRSLLESLQIVFQNPFDTLNPSFTIGAQLARAIKRQGSYKGRAAIEARLFEMLDLVKLPRDFADRLPRQLSGGQKQRVGIARAFAGNAQIVVADEPVSALDVSVQASIVRLLLDIQRVQRTAIVFISHDLSVVRYVADRVVVMYLGHVMEQGSVEQVFAAPYHPYTEALLSAVPLASSDYTKSRIVLRGELPSPVNPPRGCPFHTRCPRKIGAICEEQAPPTRELEAGHQIACHLDDAVLAGMTPVFRPSLPDTAPA